MVADEVHRLQSGKDPECTWFQGIAEQGHYAGRTQPSNTRQGIYAATPGGEFLGSLNSNDPARVARMMREALDTWQSIPVDVRRGDAPTLAPTSIQRKEDQYPEGGLVLHLFSRDLPRADDRSADWRTMAWNQDFAWFRPEEAKQWIPPERVVGAKHQVPRALVERLARSHFVDNVRGQTPPYQSRDVQRADLHTEIVAVEGSLVSLRLSGSTETAARGRWAVNGFRDMSDPQPRERGVRTHILGEAQFDTGLGRFVAFEMVAVGQRRGGTQYNGRHDDLEEAPIGFALQLAGEAPVDRVGPELFYSYGW